MKKSASPSTQKEREFLFADFQKSMQDDLYPSKATGGVFGVRAGKGPKVKIENPLAAMGINVVGGRKPEKMPLGDVLCGGFHRRAM